MKNKNKTQLKKYTTEKFKDNQKLNRMNENNIKN